MKYQVGDIVKIKSFDWFRNGACIGFSTLMSKYCGEVLTIQSINKTNTYRMKEDGGLFCWSDDMIEGMVNISKLGTAANPVEPKLNANCLTRERVDELATKIDKEMPSGNQNVWELPDGYQFVDENGNVINATKIALEKKKPEYPKTYEECVKILGFTTVYTPKVEPMFDYDDDIIALQKLKNCRDAYWKIAGEEMGLGKPWKPNWNDGKWKWCMSYSGNYIEFDQYKSKHHTLAFPTAEMRDYFYENFKELIEICKELL